MKLFPISFLDKLPKSVGGFSDGDGVAVGLFLHINKVDSILVQESRELTISKRIVFMVYSLSGKSSVSF